MLSRYFKLSVIASINKDFILIDKINTNCITSEKNKKKITYQISIRAIFNINVNQKRGKI